MKNLLNWKSAAAMLLTVGLLGSCMKDTEQTPPEPAAYINIINAYSPIASSQAKFSTGNSGILRYRESSQLVAFSSLNNLTLTFVNQSTNQVLVDQASLDLDIDKFYSGILFGKAIPGKFLLINNVEIQATETNSRLRFLNLGEGVENVDVFIGADKVTSLSNRAPEVQANAAVSEKFLLSPKAAGPNDITIRSTASGEFLAELEAFNFAANGYYTIALTGDKASTGETEEAKAKALKVSIF